MPDYSVAGLDAKAAAANENSLRPHADSKKYLGVRASDFVDFGAVTAAGGLCDGLGLVDCTKSYSGMAGACSGGGADDVAAPEGCGVGDGEGVEGKPVVREEAKLALSGAAERDDCFLIEDRAHAEAVSRIVCSAERRSVSTTEKRVSEIYGGASLARGSRRDSSLGSSGRDGQHGTEVRFDAVKQGSSDGKGRPRRRSERQISGTKVREKGRRVSFVSGSPRRSFAHSHDQEVSTKGMNAEEVVVRCPLYEENMPGKSNVTPRCRARQPLRWQRSSLSRLNDISDWSDAVSTVGTESIISEAPQPVCETSFATWVPVGPSFDSKDRLSGHVAAVSAAMFVPEDMSESSSGSSHLWSAPKDVQSYSADDEQESTGSVAGKGTSHHMVRVPEVPSGLGAGGLQAGRFDKDGDVSAGSSRWTDAEEDDAGANPDASLPLVRTGAGERVSHRDAAVLASLPRRSMNLSPGDGDDSSSGSWLGKYRLSWSSRRESDERTEEDEGFVSDATVPLSDDAYDTFCRNGKDRPRRKSYMSRLVTGTISERPPSAASSSVLSSYL